MTRPQRPGVEARRRLGKPLRLDDGVPGPGRRMHRLRHLRPRVPDPRRHDPGHRGRPDAARAAPGPDHPSGRAGPGLACRSSEVTRESLKPTTRLAVGRPLRVADQRAPERLAGLAVDGRRDARQDPIAPCQDACPAGTDAGRYVGADRPGPLRRGVRGRGRGQPVPVGLRLDLHGAVRGRLPARHAGRADRHPDASSASPPSTASCRRSPPPATRRTEKVAIVGGGPAGMSAAYYLARLGYPVTVFEAMPVPGGMMAIGIPEYRLPRDGPARGDRPDRRPRRGAPARLARWAATSPWPTSRPGLPGRLPGHGRLAQPRARRPGRRAAGRRPGDALPQAGQPRREARACAGRSSSSAVAARPWTRPGPRSRSGAASVTVLYRRGRAEMPAQVEEVEAAEREGIAHPDRHRGDRGPRPRRRDVAVRCQEQRADRPGRGRPGGLRADPGQRARDRRRRRRSWWRSARSPIRRSCPAGAGIEMSGLAGIVADPRTLATGRTGVFAGGDVVSGAKTIIDAVAPAGAPPGRSTSTSPGAADGEAEIMATVRYPTPPEPVLTVDLATRPRVASPLPVVEPGSFAATQAGLDEAAARSEAARCFRCDAVYRCRSVHVDRPAEARATAVGRSRTAPAAAAAAGRRPRITSGGRDDRDRSRRPVRRRRGIRRRDDRRRARRPVAAGRRAPPGPAVHGRATPRSSPCASAPTCGGSSTSGCATSSCSRSSWAASSSSTPTWSSGEALPITGEPGRGLRLRGPAHQADDPRRRRRRPGSSWQTILLALGVDPLHRSLHPRRPGHPAHRPARRTSSSRSS